MLPFEVHLLLALMIAATGAGTFLHIVAKEKHRRERALEQRLEAKLKEEELRRINEGPPTRPMRAPVIPMREAA